MTLLFIPFISQMEKLLSVLDNPKDIHAVQLMRVRMRSTAMVPTHGSGEPAVLPTGLHGHCHPGPTQHGEEAREEDIPAEDEGAGEDK